MQILSTLPVQIATGILCASYWRGSWYILDYTLFPNDRLVSGIVSLTAGSALLGLQQYIISPSYNGTKTLVRLLPPPTSISLRRRYIQTNRFIVLYGIATSCVLIWRGTWLLWDEAAHCIADTIASYNGTTTERMSSSSTAILGPTVAAIPLERWSLSSNTRTKISDEQYKVQSSTNKLTGLATVAISTTHHHSNGNNQHDLHHGESTVTQHPDMEENTLFYSGIASHVLATVGLLAMGRFASVMAPPANVSLLRDQFIHGQGKSFVCAVKKFIFHS